MARVITDHWIECGTRTGLVLDERFRVLLVSVSAGGVTLTVQEDEEHPKREFGFHVIQAPCRLDPDSKMWLVGSAMGVMGSLHAFYECTPEDK